MARQLIIERSPLSGKKLPERVQVQVDDQAAIGSLITTVAMRFGYPLADNYGAPVAYRLRSVSGELVLTTGRFADAHFSSGSSFVLEPDEQRTMPIQEPGQDGISSIHTRSVARRPVISAGGLSVFGLLGFGSGVTTAFAQQLLHQQNQPTASAPFSITVRLTFSQ